jgi:hypothetical protein
LQKIGTFGLGYISKKPQRIGGFHERMNNELVVLWPII